MAQYAVLMYAPVRDVEKSPTPAELEPYDRHAEEVRSAGAMVAAFALEPPPRPRPGAAMSTQMGPS